MKIEIVDAALGILRWNLPEELAAQLRNLGKAESGSITGAFENNIRIFYTALLSTVGNPQCLDSFNQAMRLMTDVLKY